MLKREAEVQQVQEEVRRNRNENSKQIEMKILGQEEALESILDLIRHMSKDRTYLEPLLLESNKSFLKIGNFIAFFVVRIESRDERRDRHHSTFKYLQEHVLDVAQIATSYLIGQGRIHDAVYKGQEASRVLEQVFGAPFSWVYSGIEKVILENPMEFGEGEDQDQNQQIPKFLQDHQELLNYTGNMANTAYGCRHNSLLNCTVPELEPIQRVHRVLGNMINAWEGCECYTAD